MRSTRRDHAERQPLTPAGLHILVALAKGERHGYSIMQEVNEASGGQVKLGTATLYRNLKRLLEDGLIVEVDDRPAAKSDDQRRRYYRLTTSGRQAALSEFAQMDRLLQEARKARLLNSPGLVPVGSGG